MGILEASVTFALSLLQEGEAFGVVSTGKVWEKLIGERIHTMLGGGDAKPAAGSTNDSAPYRTRIFSGVETTGLSATELHDAPQDLVKTRVQDAAKRLGDGARPVRTIVLGCAGMAAMEEWVRAVAPATHVIDGVRAGIVALQGALRYTP